MDGHCDWSQKHEELSVLCGIGVPDVDGGCDAFVGDKAGWWSNNRKALRLERVLTHDIPSVISGGEIS